MKGLLKKDWIMTWSTCRNLLLILILFLAVGGFGENNFFFIAYPLIISSILTIQLCSYDEAFRWDRTAATLPVSRALVVSERYLIQLFFSAVVLVLTLALQVLRFYRTGESNDLGAMFPVLLGLSLVGPSLMLPLIFKLGIQRARLGYFVLLGLIILSPMLLMNREQDGILPQSLAGASWVGTLGVLLLYAASWVLSIRLYQKREL